ncbi:hypothetical protein ACFQZE_07310 [Paenibacillus sp. GCM10027627]|uniref:hypothetical protein n=1 Tax=unclassified Paenibacillus TaxID=185978 RepID=UPI003641B2D0
MNRSKNRKTNEQFQREVFDLVGYEYLFLEEYQGTGVKISIRHNKCNYEWKVLPHNFLNHQSRCPKCANNLAYTIETIREKFFELSGVEYSVLSEDYKNVETDLLLKHNICGHEFTKKAKYLLRNGLYCPKCKRNQKDSNSNKLFWTPQLFQDKIFEIVGVEYVVLSYENKKFKIKHNICNHTYFIKPHHFINSGHRCQKCAKSLPYTIETLKERIYELVKNEYAIMDNEYVNSNTKIRIRHNTCGNEYYVAPSKFISKGNRCPECKKSRGEEKLKAILDELNVSHISQFRIDGCRNIYPLPFDEAVFDNRGNLIIIFEFDGKQHYEPIELFGGDESFKTTKKNDHIKNEYCRLNNITLVRIPYWDYNNIEKIVRISLNSQSTASLSN